MKHRYFGIQRLDLTPKKPNFKIGDTKYKKPSNFRNKGISLGISNGKSGKTAVSFNPDNNRPDIKN